MCIYSANIQKFGKLSTPHFRESAVMVRWLYVNHLRLTVILYEANDVAPAGGGVGATEIVADGVGEVGGFA